MKQIASGKLLKNRKVRMAFCDDQGGGMGGGRLKKERIRIIMTDSRCCMAESNHPPIKKTITGHPLAIPTSYNPNLPSSHLTEHLGCVCAVYG